MLQHSGPDRSTGQSFPLGQDQIDSLLGVTLPLRPEQEGPLHAARAALSRMFDQTLEREGSIDLTERARARRAAIEVRGEERVTFGEMPLSPEEIRIGLSYIMISQETRPGTKLFTPKEEPIASALIDQAREASVEAETAGQLLTLDEIWGPEGDAKIRQKLCEGLAESVGIGAFTTVQFERGIDSFAA